MSTALPAGSPIVLVAPGLSAGGTERIVSLMANWWAALGHHVSLVTLDGPEAPPFFPLDPRIALVRLGVTGQTTGAWQKLKENTRRIRVLRAALSARPGFLVSFIDVTNVLVLLATLTDRRRPIVAERTDPAMAPLPPAWRVLRRWLYPRAAAVVVQTDRARLHLDEAVGCRSVVVPNPVVPLPVAGSPRGGDGDGPHIIALGRFTPEKGFDLLLRAFAIVASRHPDVRLRIAGDGPLRKDLEQLAGDLEVAGRVDWLGQRHDVGHLLSSGDIYVLPSRFEGFPNALCEAMAAGAPVVAYDCPSGPGEIVRQGIDGLLVPAGDVDGLASAMESLLLDPAQRRRLAAAARAIVRRLSPELVMSRWERVLLGERAVP
jgi:glycosyltransferase involved in cell wall biosynthesis